MAGSFSVRSMADDVVPARTKPLPAAVACCGIMRRGDEPGDAESDDERGRRSQSRGVDGPPHGQE